MNERFPHLLQLLWITFFGLAWVNLFRPISHRKIHPPTWTVFSHHWGKCMFSHVSVNFKMCHFYQHHPFCGLPYNQYCPWHLEGHCIKLLVNNISTNHCPKWESWACIYQLPWLKFLIKFNHQVPFCHVNHWYKSLSAPAWKWCHQQCKKWYNSQMLLLFKCSREDVPWKVSLLWFFYWSRKNLPKYQVQKASWRFFFGTADT